MVLEGIDYLSNLRAMTSHFELNHSSEKLPRTVQSVMTPGNNRGLMFETSTDKMFLSDPPKQVGLVC